MSVPTPEQTERANRYHSYLRGWRDGASKERMDSKYDGHRLQCDYSDGYTAGYGAKSDAHDSAAARYGYVPSILRGADDYSEREP